MKRLGWLIILGLLLLSTQARGVTRAAGPPSDWPSLNADAAQSNDNLAERTLTAKNVLKLKIHWITTLPDASYPVVSNGQVFVPIPSQGKIHVRSLEAGTGKVLKTFTKDAFGGMVVSNGNLYLAGHALQAVDASTGAKTMQVNASPALPGGEFLNPVADGKVVLAGYSTTRKNVSATLYAIDPQTNAVLWKVPSSSAQGTIGPGRIFTDVGSGGVFYDESNGKPLASQPAVFSDWFAGSKLAYTVASVNRKPATLYAYRSNGTVAWHHAVAPAIVTMGWPHVVDDAGLYVGIMKPWKGIEALDPVTGHMLWRKNIPDVARLALANGLLFALTFNLGQPVRVVVVRAKDGVGIGSIALSPGYFGFNAANGLMVADGMVFIRAVGPKGSDLIALGL